MTTRAGRVAVVVLNWNGKADTLECLKSIQQIDYPFFEVVVVDNGSQDGSIEAIRESFPDVMLLATGKNLGYAGGNNVGIRYALDHSADYVLLLNNDTVVDSNLLTAFYQASMDVPDAGVFGAKIYFYTRPTRLWYAGALWRKDIMRFEHVGFDKEDGPQFSDLVETDYVTGCALFARAEVFRNIGLLDEDYFLTYEETDWCYRARAAGFRNMYVPSAMLWHKISVSFGGAESPLTNYFMTRNHLLWGSRHLGLRERFSLHYGYWHLIRDAILPSFSVSVAEQTFLTRLLWSFSSWVKDTRRNIANPRNKAVLLGLRDYYLRRFGDCPPAVRSLKRN